MKKYTIEELKNLAGKPVYVKVLDESHVFKSGWAIIITVDGNENVFASNGMHTILLTSFLGKWFEVYDQEPVRNSNSKVYNKLIRDNMRELIENDCKHAEFDILTGTKKKEALNNKLKEEMNEYLESGHITELADILEVIHGILEHNGKTFEDVEKIRQDKKSKKGGFSTGLFLKSIEFND